MAYDREGVALRVYDTRRALHMTQEELAGKVGASASQVSEWENAKVVPSPPNLVKLADALGFTLSGLLGYQEGGDSVG